MLAEISMLFVAVALVWAGLRMRLRYRGLVSLSLAALVLGALGLHLAGLGPDRALETASEPPASAHPARPIDWAEAAPFTGAPVRRLTGTVRAADRAALGFEVDGRVARVSAEIGDSFAKGDVLALLDTASLQIALDQARAALIEAEAMNVEAALEYRRQKTLFDRDVVSAAARDRARAAAESATSRLAVAQARVADARERLADVRLVAPYDGQIAARRIEPAQLTRAGEAAFEVQSSASGFEIEVTVPETVISRITLGTSHEAALLDGSGTLLEVTLLEIGSRATRRSGFPVVLGVTEAPASLRAGMAAEVALRLDTARGPRGEGVTVPLSSVAVESGAARAVFVYEPGPGTLRRQLVSLAGVEGRMALISEGVAPGDIVATAGLPFLRDGMQVALMGAGIARYDR